MIRCLILTIIGMLLGQAQTQLTVILLGYAHGLRLDEISALPGESL